MKKINISSQLLILFFIIILIASGAFSIITLTRINAYAEKEVYSRLSTYVYLIENKTTYQNLPDMNVGFVIDTPDNIIRSRNYDDYMSDNDFDIIIEKITEAKDAAQSSFIANGSINNSNGKKIFYVLSTKNNLADYTLIFTDTTFSTGMVKSVSIQIILIFLLLILITTYVIYMWSNGFVRRIKKIQNHIINLPKNKYEESYVDDWNDEIGELSRAVEQMRVEIGSNERTKQEMLQNLSHDFKTPITVIKSYAEAIEDGMGDENSIKVIIKQADILKKKVNRLLQYNTLEYLTKDKEFESIEMKSLILSVLETYKFRTDVDFELSLDDNVYFLGYFENFYTVVDNIIDNATRYAKSKIKIVLKKDRLRIYNDGEPIDEQFLNSVFKPYEKGSKGQFGLGMSIVKKTLDFFNYNLEVKNDACGVSFIITKNEISIDEENKN